MPSKQTYYSGAKFVVSTPGLLKITAVILFFTSSVLFVVPPICGGWSSWSGLLYPISGIVSGIVVSIMYLIFATGFAKRSYGVWFLIDLVLNVIDFTTMLIVSVVTLSHCSGPGSFLQMVPAFTLGVFTRVLMSICSSNVQKHMKFRDDIGRAEIDAPMGIIGAILLATSSAVWFAQSRRRNEVSFANEVNDQGPNIYRKSVML